MLWRARPLPVPAAEHTPRCAVSIVVPARNEAGSLPQRLMSLRPLLTPDDVVIVFDDDSDDGTSDVAGRLGAIASTAPEPPAGWLGKPNACWHGAGIARNDTLLFIDADVTVAEGFVDGIASAVEQHSDALVSVQPWHEPGSASEHFSVFFNVAALMGSGNFTIAGSLARRRMRRRVAFGPVLAIRRTTYMAIGGHADPAVHGRHTEDIALARLVDDVELYSGFPAARFRMYPGGARDLVAGWTRSLATGAWSAPVWASLAVIAWIWALAAAPFVAWWAVVAAIVQVGVLARRAGRFSPFAALMYPVPLALFVVVSARSLWRRIARRDVIWKGRDVPAR
jgi:4,4'-diaponeurosporenoate glycosyltransferase